MPNKTAVIVGSAGQDGVWLERELAANGRRVFGLRRNESTRPDGARAPAVDILDAEETSRLVRAVAPDEIYYLAAFHHASAAPALRDPSTLFDKSFQVNVRGAVNFLEAVKNHHPEARIFYAGSSLVFGQPADASQSERTPFAPACAYGISKAAGIRACSMYCADYGLFVSSGILFNHESERRPLRFLSRKIVAEAVRIKKGLSRELLLGDLSARADFGYAPDFTRAMRLILENDAPGDYVVATGEIHGVRDWLEISFGLLDLDWRDHVGEDATLLSRRRAPLVGDASKLKRHTGWRPEISFEKMVERMVAAEIGAH